MATAVAVWPGAGASAQTTALKTPNSYVLVDNDTGKVLAAGNDHQNLPPASITKLLTALVVVNEYPESRPVTIEPNAAAMPAMRIGVQANQVWSRDDLLRSMLMVSANDAAVALADATGGTLDGFSQKRYEAARELGLADSPILNDPAGLDDTTFSNDGGDRISARDMAIVARSALANPLIRQIVDTQHYVFTGPDGKSHELPNHNKMLAQYPGAIGMKTGYTQKAKNTFVGAATRNGRTMLVVVMGADNPYNYAEQLLNQGFNTPISMEAPTADALPAPLTNLGVVKPVVVAKAKSSWVPSFSSHDVAIGATSGLIILLALGVLAVRVRQAPGRVPRLENNFLNLDEEFVRD